MKYLTTKEFKEVVADFNDGNKELNLKINKNSLVMFSAQWCFPCQTVTPVLEELEREGNFNLYKVDTDEEYELSKFFNIRSIPTLVFVPIKGQPTTHTGAFPKSELKKFIAKYFVE